MAKLKPLESYYRAEKIIMFLNLIICLIVVSLYTMKGFIYYIVVGLMFSIPFIIIYFFIEVYAWRIEDTKKSATNRLALIFITLFITSWVSKVLGAIYADGKKWSLVSILFFVCFSVIAGTIAHFNYYVIYLKYYKKAFSRSGDGAEALEENRFRKVPIIAVVVEAVVALGLIIAVVLMWTK